jgi:DNA-directed RNA polymerase specialized sigma24 family protein
VGADGHGFTAFAVTSEATLLRTAFLLTGDRGSARDLVLAALARARRRWDRVERSEDPLAAVLRLLLGRHLGLRHRLWRGGQLLEAPDDLPGDRQDLVDELWRTLDQLPPRARAALVLRLGVGLDEAAVAGLLGCPAGTVRGEVAEAAWAVRGVLPAGPGAGPGAADPDVNVRDALELLAVRAGPPGGTATAEAAAASARRQRRTAAGLVAAALAVVLAGVAVATVLPDAGPVARDDPAGRTRPAGPALTDVAPRGSLAGDEEFLAGVAALDWSAPLGLGGAELAPPEAERWVLFAGDLPGDRRWALVVGEDEGQGLFAWFGGPAGAAPADLTLLAPPERFARRSTLSLLDTTGGLPVVVVVAPPGDRARYSPGTIRSDDGVVGRVWTDLPVVDGVLVAGVDPPVYPGAEVVELARDGLRPTQLEFLPRTDASAAADWPFARPLDAALLGDPAAQGRFAACLPEGFGVQFTGADGVSLSFPVVEGRRSDVELAQVYAGWDATVAACTAEALAGG